MSYQWGCSGLIVAGVVLAVLGRMAPAAEPAAKVTPNVTVSVEPPRPDGTKHKLAYKFVSGQSVRYEVVHDVQMTTRYNEAMEVASNKTEARKHYKVLGVDAEGTGELELVIDWVRMNASFGNGDVTLFESDNPEHQPPKFRHVLDSIGKAQATMRFNAVGKLLKVTPRTEAVRTPEGAANEPQHFAFLIPLPAEPAAIGSIWKDRFDLAVSVSEKLRQNVTLQTTYKLDSVARQQAVISFKTAVLTPVHDPSIAAQLIQRETTGTIKFDVQRGLIASRTVKVYRTVINPFGDKSSMHASSELVEKLIPEPLAATAVRPGEKN